MAFKTSLTLQTALKTAIDQAAATKQYMAQWEALLNADINAMQAIQLADHCRAVLATFITVSNTHGLLAYAKDQYDNASYDIVSEFTAMVSAINNVLTWLNSNIPANSVQVVSGEARLTSNTYTAVQTAGLKTRVSAVMAAIA